MSVFYAGPFYHRMPSWDDYDEYDEAWDMSCAQGVPMDVNCDNCDGEYLTDYSYDLNERVNNLPKGKVDL